MFESGNPKAAVCPCDSWMTVFPKISDLQNFAIKGTSFTLRDFLGQNESLLNDFRGGSAIICRLLPKFYHRYHTPVNSHWEGKEYHLGNVFFY